MSIRIEIDLAQDELLSYAQAKAISDLVLGSCEDAPEGHICPPLSEVQQEFIKKSLAPVIENLCNPGENSTKHPRDYLTDAEVRNKPAENSIAVITNFDTESAEHHAEEIEEEFEDETGVALPVALNELDVDGIPWDKRIHAGTKNKTKDGRWKIVRGCEPEFAESVKNELRAKHNLQNQIDDESPKNSIPVPPLPSSPPPPPPSIVNPGAIEFGALVAKITKAQSEKKLTAISVLEILKSLGLSSVVELSQRPDLVPQINMLIDGIIS